MPSSFTNSTVLVSLCVCPYTVAIILKIYQRCGTQSWGGTVRRREWGTTALRRGSGRSRAPRSDCTTRGGSRVTVWRAGTSESGITQTVCTGINRPIQTDNTHTDQTGCVRTNWYIWICRGTSITGQSKIYWLASEPLPKQWASLVSPVLL